MNGAYNNYGNTQYSSVPFIGVPDIMSAYMYPLTPGNSANFVNTTENEPYVYKKTVTFENPRAPIFEIYELVPKRIEQFMAQPTPAQTPSSTNEDQISSLVDEIKNLSSKWDQRFEELQKTVNGIKFNRPHNKKEVSMND